MVRKFCPRSGQKGESKRVTGKARVTFLFSANLNNWIINYFLEYDVFKIFTLIYVQMAE